MNDDDYDPAVYSGTSVLNTGGPGLRRLTWRELAEQAQDDVRHLTRFRRLVTDLDRNAHGRHEGDVDGGDPTGVSQGNPLMPTGTTIGYSLGGDPYVMPERGQRHDPGAWGAR